MEIANNSILVSRGGISSLVINRKFYIRIVTARYKKS